MITNPEMVVRWELSGDFAECEVARLNRIVRETVDRLIQFEGHPTRYGVVVDVVKPRPRMS